MPRAKRSYMRSSSTIAQVWPSTTLQDSQKIWKQDKLLSSSGGKKKKEYTHTHTSSLRGKMMVQQWHNRQIQYWKAGLACSSPCREAVRNQTSTTPQLCVRLPALHTLNTKCLKKSGTPSRLPTCYSNPVFPVQVWKASTVPFCFLFTLHNATKIAASGNASYWRSQFPKQRLTSFQQQNTSTYSLGSGLTVVRVDQNRSFLPTPTVL